MPLLLRSRCFFLLLAWTTGCNSLFVEPRNPVQLERAWGVATAEDRADAEELAELVDGIRASYRDLTGFRDRRLRIHSVTGELPYDVAGACIHLDSGDAWIIVASTARELAPTVAHELAHFYFRPVLVSLPQILEEGFCDLLAELVHPDPNQDRLLFGVALAYLNSFTLRIVGPDARESLAYFTADYPTLTEAMEMGDDAYVKASASARTAMYGLGWILAKNIGSDGLLRMLERAREAGLERIPPAWIWEAVEIDPHTARGLREALARAVNVDPAQELILTVGSPPNR